MDSSYQWWMSNDQGMTPQVVSNAFNLNYIFKTPGKYSVWLIAANGSCNDTTEIFKFPVFDPTADGTIGLSDVHCYQQTKITQPSAYAMADMRQYPRVHRLVFMMQTHGTVMPTDYQRYF